MKIFALLSLFLYVGCGVKGPPIAPVRDPVPPKLELNCSPQDPKCDVEDPNYVPQNSVGSSQKKQPQGKPSADKPASSKPSSKTAPSSSR